jgi:hypothetical protein
MKKIEDGAASLFILAVTVLSCVSILGVWDLFSHDVINKSFQTLGLLAVVAIIVMVSGKFIENKSQQVVPDMPNPVFKSIRQIALTILIISVSFLAILGVLAIWEVIQDKEVLYKCLSSVGILAFGTFIVVVTALDREGNNFMNRNDKKMSPGAIVLVIILVFTVFSFLGGFR